MRQWIMMSRDNALLTHQCTRGENLWHVTIWQHWTFCTHTTYSYKKPHHTIITGKYPAPSVLSHITTYQCTALNRQWCGLVTTSNVNFNHNRKVCLLLVFKRKQWIIRVSFKKSTGMPRPQTVQPMQQVQWHKTTGDSFCDLFHTIFLGLKIWTWIK